MSIYADLGIAGSSEYTEFWPGGNGIGGHLGMVWGPVQRALTNDLHETEDY